MRAISNSDHLISRILDQAKELNYVVFKSYDYLNHRFSEKDIDVLVNPKEIDTLVKILTKECKVVYENPIEKKIKLVCNSLNIDIYDYVGKKRIVLYKDVSEILRRKTRIRLHGKTLNVVDPIIDFCIRCALLPLDIRKNEFNQKISELQKLSCYILKRYDRKDITSTLILFISKSSYRYSLKKLLLQLLSFTAFKSFFTHYNIQRKTSIKTFVYHNKILCNPYLFMLKFMIDVFQEDIAINKNPKSLCILFKLTRHFLAILFLDLRDSLIQRLR